MEVYNVTFKENGKQYMFNGHDLEIKLETNVIVETEKGLQFGKVMKKAGSEARKFEGNIKDIIRIATEDDYEKYLKNNKDAATALDNCRKIVEELELDMNVIDATYTFDRKQLLFNFVSSGRVDFRELAKRLANVYRTRIELRQIGVRDKAREVGGHGCCGRNLCCNSFLNHMDAVSINMAKNQNIALNPNKINGVCGRLLCCLSYEDDTYTEYAAKLPQVGDIIKYRGRSGKVTNVSVLEQKFKVDIDGEIIEVDGRDEKQK